MTIASLYSVRGAHPLLQWVQSSCLHGSKQYCDAPLGQPPHSPCVDFTCVYYFANYIHCLTTFLRSGLVQDVPIFRIDSRNPHSQLHSTFQVTHVIYNAGGAFFRFYARDSREVPRKDLCLTNQGVLPKMIETKSNWELEASQHVAMPSEQSW